MNKILIASKNKDKIAIIKRIIDSISVERFDIVSLRDITTIKKTENEEGTIFQRAERKAKDTLEGLLNNDYKYIVGIDDGIIVKDYLYENVKDLIKPIINGEYLEDGEIVYIARAYHFIRNDGKNFSVLTKIPFEFHKSIKNIEISPESYPLSNVLCKLNTNIPVSRNTDEENNNYYLNYSCSPLMEVFNDNNR